MTTQPRKQANTGPTPRKVVRRKRKPQSNMEKSFQAAWSYILHEVLIPGARDTLAKALHAGTDSIVYGNEDTPRRRSSSRGSVRKSSNGSTYVRYDKVSKSSRYEKPSEERMVRSVARREQYDEIILGTRDEAEDVITTLYDLIDSYEMATIADLYSQVGIPAKHTDEKWGWYDLRGANVKRVRMGYLIDLPKPEWLE